MVVIVLSWKVSWPKENVKLCALELFKDMECLSQYLFITNSLLHFQVFMVITPLKNGNKRRQQTCYRLDLSKKDVNVHIGGSQLQEKAKKSKCHNTTDF